MYVYGFCDGSATAAVEEYRRRFPMRRIPDRRVFYKVCNTLRECGTHPSAHVSSERARKQTMEEEENILDMVQRSLLLAREDFQHVSVFHGFKTTQLAAWLVVGPITALPQDADRPIFRKI